MPQPKRLDPVIENITEANVMLSLEKMTQSLKAAFLMSVTAYLFYDNGKPGADMTIVRKAYANAFNVSGAPLLSAE